MCEYGYPHELLSHGYIALADETHPLHPSLRSMFERLASQSLTPRDLRYIYIYIFMNRYKIEIEQSVKTVKCKTC